MAPARRTRSGANQQRVFRPGGDGESVAPPAGVVSSVEVGSLAERLRLRAGDEILAVNNKQPLDVIDVRFLAAPGRVRFRVRRDGSEFDAGGERGEDEPLGIEFATATFDGIRLCNNRCTFCSVAQMPPGLRRSLYVKDDDYRYSFLFGNYVTLTNLSHSDWKRIRRQRLSPLYVSVHTTDRELRRCLLANPEAPDVLAQLRRLGRLGIVVHAQIVVLPGLNDGPHLDRSIDDLAALYPSVESLSIAPLALTRFHKKGLRLHNSEEMEQVVEQVTSRQEGLRERLGVGFAYLSAEWYMRLGVALPPLSAYDDLDLTENGVGLVRRFLDGEEHRPLAARLPPAEEGQLTLVTGQMFAPVLSRATAHLPHVRVTPITNHFFGPTITAAGLLAGKDVIEQLKATSAGALVLLPSSMFGAADGESVDGMAPADVAAAAGVTVRLSDTLGP